ncbi:MAG: prepilin peptidase [Gloeomargaritaceae cyanobacterium C42_A2020_066]|nr:prepilin peptidase [Gloeomargaritaceae cyanobacterium C42_A2020_066]
MESLPLVLAITLGAAVGSFLNVVAYRLPQGLSLLSPPSRCPHCLTPLKPWENVPVLGWLWLRGRCGTCREAIAGRYPLVEALTALLFAGLYLSYGPSVLTLGGWVFTSWLLALALIDLDTFTLPDRLTQPGLVVGLLFYSGATWAAGRSPWEGLWQGVLGMVVGLWLLELLGLGASLILGQTALGGGDPKLAALLGAWLGWKHLLVALGLACLSGTLIGLGGRAAGRLRQGQRIPFGPFLALGGILTLFVGDRLLQWYLRWLLPTA